MTTTNEMFELKPIDLDESGKKQKQAQKLAQQIPKPRKKNGCRNNHHSCHSPHKELEFCKNCDAYVETRPSNICECCEKTIAKFLKHTWLTRVLKFGIKQHANYIRDWSRYPEQGVEVAKLEKPYTWIQTFPDGTTKKIKVTEGFIKKPKHSQYLEIKYRETVYEIEIKYLAFTLEVNDGTDDNAKIQGGEDAKLNIIKKHIGIKGFRIWIPEEENYEYFPKEDE